MSDLLPIKQMGVGAEFASVSVLNLHWNYYFINISVIVINRGARDQLPPSAINSLNFRQN